MLCNRLNCVASAGFAALLLVSAPSLAQVLGTASNFAVLGATPNVTCTGSSVVTGDVGVSPALSVVGFPVPCTDLGTVHPAFVGDTAAGLAQTDNNSAFTTLAGLVATGGAIGPGLGGLTLTPGVYTAGAANLTGTLTLNGPGLYVIQTSALTTAAGPGASKVRLINGATPCNVWWTVANSASIGTFSVVQGNILASTSITIDTGATLLGRALAHTGTVTLAADTVTACSGGTAPYNVPGSFPNIPFGGGGSGGGSAIPTLSQWAMVMLAALLAIAGFAAMRSRNT